MGYKSPPAPASQVLTLAEKQKLDAIVDIRSVSSPLNMSGTAIQFDDSAFVKDTDIDYGDYAPTVAAGANITSTANETGLATRLVDIVTVTVGMTVTPTLAVNTPTSFEIDLPIASNFGSTYDLMGSGCFAGGIGAPVLVTGSVANNTAVVSFASTLAGAAELRITFQYKVIP